MSSSRRRPSSSTAPSVPTSPGRPRRTTRAAGNAGERRAEDFLVARHGYEIVARQYRCRAGEIDLVARDGDMLCFVEVRTRESDRLGHPAETIGPVKQRRIAAAAARFLLQHGQGRSACRFDVVTIVGSDEPQLVRNAFDLTDLHY